MDEEKRRKKKSRHMCTLCDTKCSNDKELTAHYVTAFHKFMVGIKRTQMSYVGNGKTLNEQITESGKKDPLIGLEYIYEYAEDSKGVRMYECKLCDSAYKLNAIFFHIVGVQHRVLYLAKHHPIMGIEAGYEVLQQVHYRKLSNNALAIEQTHGRKKINVVNEVYVSKPNIPEVSDSESFTEDRIQEISPAGNAGSKRARKKRNRLAKQFDGARSQLDYDDYDDDEDDGSWQYEYEDELESQHGHVDVPSFLLQDEDFDARPLQRARSPVPQYDRRDNANVQGLAGDGHPQSTYRNLGPASQYDKRDSASLQGPAGATYPQSSYSNLGPASQNDKRDSASVQGLAGATYPQSSYSTLGPASQNEKRDSASLQGLAGATYPQSSYSTLGPASQNDKRADANVQGPAGDQYPLVMYPNLGPVSQYGKRADATVQGVGAAHYPQTTYPNLGSGYQSDNRTIPKFPQGTLGSMAQHHSAGVGTAPRGIDSVPPYQRPADPAPAVGTTITPVVVGGTISRDDFEDTDFRQINRDRDKEDRSKRDGDARSSRDGDARSSRKGDTRSSRDGDSRSRRKRSSSAGDSKDRSRRRKRSPEPRSRTRRHGSRSEKRGGDIDVRSVLPSGGISFRELRAAHDGRKLPEGFSSANLPMFKKKKPEKETDSDMEVCSMDLSDCDPDEFWCNEELFDFLKAYYIGDEVDVQFVTEASKIMSEALARHKSRKDDLKKRILAEKQRLQEEKEAFQMVKKRKEEKIALTSTTHPDDNASLLRKGSKQQKEPASGTAPAVPKPQAEKTSQPLEVPSSLKPAVSGIAPVILQAIQGPQAVKVNQPPPLAANLQSALMSSLGTLLQLFQRPQVAAKVPQPKPVTSSQKAPTSALVPPAQPAVPKPQGSETHFNPNPAPRLANPYTSKEQTPYLGQGTSIYPAPENLSKPPPPATQAPETRYSQNPQFPGSTKSYPPKEPAPYPGQQAAPRPQESDSRYSQSNQYPGSQVATSGFLEKTKPLGADSDMRFGQTPGVPGTSKAPTPMTGQAAGGYSAPDNRYGQNPQYPGSRIDSSVIFDKTKPPPSTDSDMRFGQTSGVPAPSKAPTPMTGQAAGGYSDSDMRFGQTPGAPGTSKAPTPMTGQAAGGYSAADNRYGQNPQYLGSRIDSSVIFDKTKPPPSTGSDMHFGQTLAAPVPSKAPTPMTGQAAGGYSDQEAKYKQTSWNSGLQSGNQGVYNEARPTTAVGAAGYGDQYSQNQWQSQYSSRGAAQSETRSGFASGSQSLQPMGSTGFSSDRTQGTWLKPDPSKAGTFPPSITDKARNIP